MAMTDEQAAEAFQAIRWADTGGKPYCPRCRCAALYTYTTRALWKCKACSHQFSVTSGTIFASRKLAIREILVAIALFTNAAKGISALQLSRDLGVQYRTAFVLSHKLREAMRAECQLSGEVEVDGGYFGGHVKPENRKEDRKDRRLAANQTGKRQVVVVMRERKGRTLPFVFRSEDEAVPLVQKHVAAGSVIHADEAPAWDALHAKYLTKRVNHKWAYSENGACTNQAESYFSRLRRAEVGTHHHIAGPYLGLYAAEMAWREDNRRVSNGEQYLMLVGAALAAPVSRQWKGYSQRWMVA
jgi:transposase-like protein